MNICKILIIVIVAIYLLGNFSPFYEGQDSYLYGIIATNFSQGIFEITNPLLTETIEIGFKGTNWIPTVHDTMVPIGGMGTPILSAIAFTIGGYYGLFYLGPILGILLLIVYERISTKLFDKYVGLLVLLLFASCHIFFRSAVLLNTDAMLTLFFIPGIFYLIKFLKTGNERYVFLTSCLFVMSSLIKNPALVYFPLETITIVVYFIIQITRNRIVFAGSHNNKQTVLFTVNRKKLLKISLFVIIPWILFFSFWLSYNDYFFGNPTTTYISVLNNEESSSTSKIGSLLTLDHRDFEQFKDYGKYLLPYQISATYNRTNSDLDEIFGSNWPGLALIPLLISSLFFSFKTKSHRIEFLVFILFISGIIAFYSGLSSEERAEFGLPARYMLPAITLTFLLWSFMIVKGFEMLNSYSKIKYLKILFLIILGIFFISAFIFTPPIQFLIDGDTFKNPLDALEKYPFENENLSSKSVLLVETTDYAIDYDSVPFSINDAHTWDSEKISVINEVLDNNYSIYTFKISKSKSEHDNLLYIINNHDFILQEFSDTFCQLHKNDGNLTNSEICISNFVHSTENKKYDLPLID